MEVFRVYHNKITLTRKEVEEAWKIGNLMLEDMQEGYAVKDIKKPFGGFEDFSQCILGQKERGHSDESADRICAAAHRYLKGR